MKDATGELNMTLVVIIAVAGVMAFALIFIPMISNVVNSTFQNISTQTVRPF
jgi:hypothetical protein